jgi:MFS transporter, DHA2 family, multidrug resistance protein
MSQELIHKRRWEILGVLILSLLVVVLDTSILNVALKTLAEPKPKGLGASQTSLEWALDAYTLAFAGLLFTWGILGDRIGRKRMLLGGMVAFGVFSALCAFAQTPGELIAGRALMGIAGAAVMPTTISIISNVFDPQERPKAIGIWAGAVGIALAIGPITGGLLLAHFWWGSVFLVNVPIVIVAVGLMIWLVPDSRNPKPGKLDPLGVVLSIIGITVFTFGIIRGGDIGWGSAQALAGMIVGLTVLVGFVLWERRVASPILDTKLFKSRRFSAAIAIVALLFCAYMGLVFVLSFYWQAARGYSALHAGALLLPLAAGQLIFSSRSDTFVRRFGPRAVVSTGLGILVLTFTFYVFATAHTPVLLVEVVLCLQGIAIGLVMPPTTSSVMGAVPRERSGEASAISNTSRQVGGAFGVAIIGALLASAYRSGINPHLAAIPALAHDPAALNNVSSSLTATLSFSQQYGAHALVSPAISSFIHGMHEASIASVVIAAIAFVASVRWLAGRQEAMATRAAMAAQQAGALSESPVEEAEIASAVVEL